MVYHVCAMIHGMSNPSNGLRALAALAMLPFLAGAGDAPCLLCRPDEKAIATARPDEIPISIDITTKLDFSRVGLTGGGSGAVSLDPMGGTRSVDGELIDLGGLPLAGQAVVRGEPGRSVRIDMPANARMISATGGDVEIVGLKTDLPAGPRLDSNGRLTFSFGGRLLVRGDASGTFRGRIPITAEYE